MNKIAAGMVAFITIMSGFFFLMDQLGLFAIDTCARFFTFIGGILPYFMIIFFIIIALRFNKLKKFDVLFMWIGCSTGIWGVWAFNFYYIVEHGYVKMIEPNRFIAKTELIMCLFFCLVGIYFFYEAMGVYEGEKDG